jgi:SAM-dependent methyltransferase
MSLSSTILTAEACAACAGREAVAIFSGTDRLYGITEEMFQVVRCHRCGLLRLSPRPGPRELPAFYPPSYWYAGKEDDKVGALEQFWRRTVLRDHARFVQSALESTPAAGLLLDVGCGGGLFLRQMKEMGYPVMGLDFSLDAASIAWRQNGVPAICGTLTQAPLPAGSCRAVTMFHVLEHLYSPQDYIEHARRLLAPDGRLIVQVPDASSWQFLLFGERWSGLDIPRHLVNFRGSDLEVLIERCGFRIVRKRHFSLRDNPAAFATSLAPNLDPMARRIRKISESSAQRLVKDLLYMGLFFAGLPLSVLESMCGSGATIFIEAVPSSA